MSNQKQRAQDDPLKYFNLIDKVKEANTKRSQEDADARIEEREEEMRAQIMGDKFRQSMDAMGQKLDDTAESVITFDQKYNPNRQEGLSRTLQADIQRAKKVEEAMSNLPELEKSKAQEKYKKQAAAITDFDLKDAIKGEDEFVQVMNSPSKPSYKATFGNYGHDGYGHLVRITNNTMENIGLNDYLDGVSAEVIKDMPRNRRGNIMVGGKEYTEEEVKAAVTPLIIEANHEALMGQSHEYRDEVFKANTGMTYKQWATSRVQDLAARVTELRKIVGDAAYWEEKERAINTAKSIGSFAPEATARNIALGAETEAQKPFDDFIEQLESWAYNDFGSGFSATFDGMSVLTGGLVDLFGAKNMSEVLEAAERGEKLDVRGQAMLELHMIQEEIAGLRDVVFAPQSTWNKIGEGVGTSAGEIGGFAIGMLAGGGIGSFANLGVKGAVATTKYAAKKSVLKGIGTGIAQTTKVGTRLTYNAGLAYTRGAVGSLVMPSTYTRYYEGVNSQYSVKEDGTVTFTPKDAESSFLGYWVDNANELTSEMFGVGLGKVLSFGSRWFGRTIALNKIAQKMHLDSPNIKRAVKKLTPGKTQKKVMSYLGVSGGAIAEPLSEVYGDFSAQVGRMAMGLPYDFNQFSDADYWKTTAMVSAIYGGSLSVGATAMNVPSLYNVHQLGKMSRLSLNKIEDEELRNKLELITIDGNIERASQELAGIDWSNIASTDRGYAFDYIRHNYAYQVALGERQETTRMNQFAAEAHHITSLSYRGIDGKEATGNLVLATLNDGRRLFVLEGNYTDADGILKCTDELGNVEPIHVSHLKEIRTREVESEVSLAYDKAFKGVIEEERMNEIEAAYKGMRETGKLKEEDAKRLMADYGVSVQIGEKTQLVDGREAVVEDIMDDGYILVGVKDATTGEMELLSIPFYDIMSSAPLTAEVQSKRLAERTVEKMKEEVDKESSDIATEEAVSSIEGETAAGVEVETTTPTNGNIEAESTADTGSEVAVGKIIRTKNGQQARVMAVNEDGSIEVDYNLDENSTYEDAEYDVISVEDVLSEAAEDKQKEVQETPAEEDAAEEIKEIINEITEAESIPQTKDGDIDYDAIDNPEQFAALYEREAGDKDTAINDVREMRAAAEEQLAKSVEKGKKLSSANEKTANRNERKALTERIAFYDAVLDVLSPRSVESASESAEADIVEPQTEVETTTETTSFTPGLVEDEYTTKLSGKRRKALHDVAVALGLRVRFVDAVRTAAGGLANADISGNEVRIAWSKRDKAISFLVGHEFTHRMQELSPKEYASFKESVKAYMGDERWNALVAKTRSIYEAHNAREMARAEAEHRAPRLLQYSVELIEDEVVADFAGELNEDANALAAFAEKLAEKPSTLKAVIAVLRDILNKLKGLVAGAEAQRLANMLSKFEELYRASASRTTEGQTQSKEKYSLSDEQAAIIIEAMKANAVVAPQIELTPENWIAEFGAEGVVSTPIGEVIMGEHQYKKLIDNKRNNDFGKVKPTLTNPDIVLEEYDPKEGALRDTKYLFIKTFTKPNREKVIYFTSVTVKQEGGEVSISSHRIKNEKKLKEKMHNDNVVHLKETLLDSEVRLTKPQSEGSDLVPTPSVISESKDTTSSPIMQEESTKFSLQELDAPYLDAVERGDMETAQRMVLEAAKLAMPDTKVVDEDGDPKVVYHGTPNLFNVFSKEMFGTSTDRGIWGNGFYFSESPKYADTYKSREGKEGRTISAYLNIKSPLHIYVSRRDDEGQAYFHALMEKHFNDEVYADVTKQEENMRKAQYELSAEMINDGYDGVIVHYPNDFMGNEYIAFEPNQIKSAEPVTYDDNGNIIPLSERFNFEKEDIRYSISSQPIFYSNAEYAVRGIKQEKATPEQWLKMIEKNGGLKAGEDKWLGLSDWLKASDKKTLTKDEVLQYIAENDIQIEEVEYAQFGPGLIDEATRNLEAEMREIGIEAMREKYDGFDDLFEVYNGELLWSEERASEGEYKDFIIENNIVDVNAQANAINETRLGYTTNGLNNKREIALTVPTIEPWNTSDNIHFGDAGEGRAVAWVRFGETTDADGKRVLVIDEIQSKRHQEGRDKGYSDKRVSQQELYDAQEEAFSKVIDYESALADKYGEDEWASLASEEEMAEYERLRAIDEAATNAYENYDTGIPSAPFEKNWAELAMKRMLRYAAENGFDKVAWTTGDQQAERYDLGKSIDYIEAQRNENGTYNLNVATNDDSHYVQEDNIPESRLSEVLGKDMMQSIVMGTQDSEDGSVIIEGDGLRIGGEGMKAFYDQMLPSFVRKYAKKWGAMVSEVTMPALEKNNTMHSVDVTPAMRESVMQGQPKFSLRGSDKSLVGLHNISLDKLRKAIKMGGLANPSVAVIDVDKATHEDYGDYTLVLTSNMVDARLGRNAGTWAGDAWTPTYPQVTKRIPMSKDITRFHKDINKMPEAIRNRVRLQWDSFLDGRDANSFAYWYLFEKGVAPEMAVIPPVFPDDIVKMVSEATDGTFNMWQKSDEQKARCVDAYIAYKYDGDRAAYEADLQSRKERLQRALNTTKSQLVVKKAAGDLAALEEFGFDYDAVSTFLREVETDNSRRGQSDVQGTIRLAENYIKDNNLEEDYQSWRDSLEGRYGVKEYIFNGYTDSGNQRWLPHTTANASKWMKKQGREGATGTFPSFGLFVATVIPRMITLNTIRKRKGHLGRPEQEYEEFEEKWKNVYYELGQKLQPDAERFEDYGWWRLIEAISTNNPKEFIKKQYGIDISAEDMQKLNDMLDAIKSNYPARYFETKFERPVELNEFIAAIVPNDIPADVEASLQEAYLNIYKYDKGVEGSRQEAVLEATDSPNVRFSLRLPKVEYASLSSIIMTRQHTYQRPSFDYAFTAHNFYVYDYLGDGDSIINFAMPIVGNEEIIDVINKAIDNGAITDARSLDTLLEEIQSGKRGYNVNIVNALKKRGWNKNIYISGTSRQGRNTRGVSNVSKSHSGLSPRKRAGGNTDESAHKGVETRLSMPMPDDIFFDDNGDIISFGGDDVREATTIVRRAPKTTEERIKMYMESRHLAMMQRIRKDADDEIRLIRQRYNEEREKRTVALGNMRGASAKIDYILGDTPREALPLYDQALILLAEGEVKIRWEDDGTLKGLASELGYKKGEKARMRNITGGATLSFEAFVHQWWQSIGGYANGIDTQDMRNALIEALQDTGGSSTRALAKIRSTYDVARTERDNSLYDVDARRESALAEEEQRYKKEIEAFDTREDKANIIRQYEQSVAAYDEMESIDGLLRHLDEEIRAMRSRAERAESRESQSRKDIYEGIRRGKQAIMEAVRRIKVLHYNSQELNSLLSNISAVRSIKQLSALQERVENIITSIQIREENNNFDKLLNLRLPNWQMVETWVNEKVYNGVMTAAEGKRIMSDMWRGTNSRGVAVAKYVDQATGDVMRELRDMVSKVKKRRYEDKEDENGAVNKVLSEDKELSMDVAAARKANGERAVQLATKNLRGEATAEEITEMKARYLYSYYLDVVEAKQNMLKAKSAFEEAIGNSAVDTADARSDYFASKEAYRDVLRRVNIELDEFITKGRDAYKSFMEAQEEHRQEIVRMGLNAIGKQKPKDGLPLNWWQKVREWNRRFINNPYWTFETTLREIDHLSPNGKGEFYNFWMQQAQSASDEFVVKQITHVSRLGEEINRLWGFKYSDPATAFMAIKRGANEKILLTIKYTKYDEVDGDIVKRQNSQPITIANGLYMLAMWGQERYRRGMEKQGITVNDIMSITQAILNEPNGEQYIAFKDWVIGTFLTDTREEYDVTHQRMFGTSMDKEANYFPAKVVDRHRDEQLGNDNNNIGDLYVSGIIRRQTTSAMIDAGADFFAVLGEHIQSMDRWSAFAELQRDIKYLINSNEFKDRLVAHMPGKGDHKDGEGSLYHIFFTAAEILLDKYKSKATVIDNIALMAQKGWATANISWRWMTAIKQLASLPTFLYYADDSQLNKLFWKNVAKYGVEAWKYKQLHEWCKSVSPSYRRRWQTGDMGIEFLGRKISTASQNADIRRAQHPKVVKGFEWFDKVFTTVGKDVGMFANKAIDAFSVAVGLRTIYEFEVSRLTENGKKELTEEMKKEAVLRAEMAFNATQQSSENAYLAEIQKQRSVASAVVTTYLNQPFAMHRLRMGAMNELWNQFFNTEAYVLSLIDKYGKDWQKEMRAARHRAYAEFMQGILSDYLFQLIGTGIGGVCLLSAAIDDDEDEVLLGMIQEVAFNGLVSTTFGGYLGGNLVQSAIGGYFKRPSDLVSMPAQEELVSGVWETVEALSRGDATVSLYNTLVMLARYRYGVDPETALNIIAGVEAIIKDEGTAEGILKILNAPRSQVALVAGKRREGESVWEYIDRRVRVELIGATPPATELFDEDNMKYIGNLGDDDYKVKKFFKEYNEAQTAKVWKEILTEVERLSFAAADVRYADICALVGWTPGSMPKDESIDKSVRPYIYPAGLDSRSYKTIKREATAVEKIRNELERFVGTDEAYAEKLRHMYDKMQKLINIYDGINK